MIIDGHTHVASTHFIPQPFFEGVARNMAMEISSYGMPAETNRIIDMLLSQHQDHFADEFVSVMNHAQVDKAVLLVPDFTFIMKSNYSISEMADKHAEIRLRHPGKFYVFFGVDPRWGSDGLDLFVNCVEKYGFEGLKLYPPCGYSPSDERLFPFYEYCAAKKLPVLLHTGPTSPVLTFEEASPFKLDKAAHQFPSVNFILAHGGAVNVDATIQLCKYRPNVFCDVSGFNSIGSKTNWKSHFEYLFSKGINHKIIFGTDWPVFKNKENHAETIEYFSSQTGPLESLSERDKKLFLGKNILRLIEK